MSATPLIAEVMTREVCACARGHTVGQVARAMEMHGIGALPVCEDGELLGIVTDRDIVVRALAHDLPRTRVEFIMSTDVATCYEDETVAEVLERMRAQQLRRMPVLRRGDDALAGIVSLADLASHADARMLGSTLEAISRPVPLEEGPPGNPATGLAL